MGSSPILRTLGKPLKVPYLQAFRGFFLRLWTKLKNSVFMRFIDTVYKNLVHDLVHQLMWV